MGPNPLRDFEHSSLYQGVVFAVQELLDGSTIPSSVALSAMKKWKANLTEFQEVLGQNEVLLEERGASEESNIGDVICDAFASAHPNTRYFDIWKRHPDIG